MKEMLRYLPDTVYLHAHDRYREYDGNTMTMRYNVVEVSTRDVVRIFLRLQETAIKEAAEETNQYRRFEAIRKIRELSHF